MDRTSNRNLIVAMRKDQGSDRGFDHDFISPAGRDDSAGQQRDLRREPGHVWRGIKRERC